MEYTKCQQRALATLEGSNNIFLTGVAGAGKTTVLDAYVQTHPGVVVLASTGVAAILIGGTTFHSFFGLGVMAGPDELIIPARLS